MKLRHRIADWISGGELTRKESVILKYKAGMVRRDDMAAQIDRLIVDRDHWKTAAENGSRTMSRTLNNWREKALQYQSRLDRIAALAKPTSNATVRRMARIARGEE